jgi:Flp pilus assembly protein TadD
MTVFTGDVCTSCSRPVHVDEKSPQVARCRKCGAAYHTQCWFSSGEKCIYPGCDGKASDIGPPKVKEPIGDACPFLPIEPVKREGGEASPARCLRGKCMLYDAVEARCSLGQIGYAVATIRHTGGATRTLIQNAVGNSSKQSVQLLTAMTNSLRSAEAGLKGLSVPQEKLQKQIDSIAGLLGEVRGAIQALGGDQQATAEGLSRLASAVEASGVGEKVRSRREARLAARAALRDGRPGAAVNLLLQAQKRAPDEAVDGDLATAYLLHGKGAEATSVLESVLKSNPDNTSCRITLAGLRLKEGAAQQAEVLLRDAPPPQNPLLRAELAYARACVAYAVGRSEDAVGLLNEALDLDPWHASAAAALSDLRARRSGEPVPDAAAIALKSRKER